MAEESKKKRVGSVFAFTIVRHEKDVIDVFLSADLSRLVSRLLFDN
jgi:hypothetical protein